MDFNQQVIFGDKTFSDLLKDIYDNSRKKEKQIKEMINQLQPMIVEPGDAMLLVPLLKEYMELGIKNDEHLIKMAGIVQRAMNNTEGKGSDLSLSEQELEQLHKEVQSISVTKK